MPRIHQNAEQYADEDFRRELYRKLAGLGLRHDQDLAEVSGLPVSTTSRKLKDPTGFTIRQMRCIVAAVHPDPVEMLKFLGYTTKEIKKMEDPK